MRHIKILGIGSYTPPHKVSAEEIDQRLGVLPGWTKKTTGVLTRSFVTNETSVEMASFAIQHALKDANLTIDDIDCIVSTSGTAAQAIPCTASLIQEQLHASDTGIPCFDINSTCLSFVTGLDVISYMIEAGRYDRVLLVSSEIASVGLDWNNKESAALFGDGAVAVVIGKTPVGECSKIIHSNMQTYSKGAHHSEILGGGTSKHPTRTELSTDDFLFKMNGKAIFKLSSQLLPDFFENALRSSSLALDDIKLVIPHQASAMAMRIIQKKLGIKQGQFFNIIEHYGNMISASIPMGIYEAIQQQKLQRGDKFMLLGTSAGLSIGGMILEY